VSASEEFTPPGEWPELADSATSKPIGQRLGAIDGCRLKLPDATRRFHAPNLLSFPLQPCANDRRNLNQVDESIVFRDVQINSFNTAG